MSEIISLPPEYVVGKAEDPDLENVSTILASAFSEDPVFSWMSGHKNIYSKLFLYEIEALYKHHNHVYVNEEKTGAALWLPAGISAHVPYHWRALPAVWAMLRTGGYKSLMRADKMMKIMSDNHPSEPYFYLHAIGAKLGNQGRGIGSALLKTGLHVCDEQKLPAFLESTNEKNNPLYERFGFEIIGETTLPENGPTIWFMQRPAR